MAQPAPSAITMAFSKQSASIDIVGTGSQHASARFTAPAKGHHGLLLTPPNSISPNLPAHAVRAGLASPPHRPLDHDLDLQDAVEHAKAQDQPNLAPTPLSKEALSGLEKAELITPALLAKDYLPKILLGHGDVAIRHVIGCLNNDVPGFSKMEPAKARRVVVAALENRTGGGPDGNIQFVKVGWGRWLAHTKGEAPSSRSINTFNRSRLSPAASDVSSCAASYSSTYPVNKKLMNSKAILGQSYTGSDMPSLDEGLEDMSISDHCADDMSLDGSDSDSTSDTADDETDEEDWAAIGPVALRERESKLSAATGGVRRNYNLLCIPGPVYKRRMSSTSGISKTSRPRIASSAPQDSSLSRRYSSQYNFNNKRAANPTDLDPEREAARALLSLGSLPLTAAELKAHPEYPHITWDLKPAKSGISSVAEGRGGPIDIAWEVHGSGPRHLLWIMGLASLKEAWQRQTKDFAHTESTTYSSLLVDNRGMGLSSKPMMRYSTSQMALDIYEVLHHVKWTSPRSLHIIGISMGGMIAQELALLAPDLVSSLTLVSTAPRIVNTIGWVENLRNRVNLFLPKSLDEQIRQTKGNMYTQDWLEGEDETESIVQRFPTNGDRFAAGEVKKRGDAERFSRVGFICQAVAAGWHYKSKEQLEDLAERVGRERIAVVHGTEDRMLVFHHAEMLLDELGGESSGISKFFFEGQGHVIPIEKRKEFKEIIVGMCEKGEKANERLGAKLG
ncbi:Protein STB3 [Sphaceloma murrayae]|uniref:Protein STB3 n=1 Tax=Sphaceloma murrayae TaxID=2082308 RepID=A0A2K1QYD0_9PEZI|nr:Protein STB3 [Sphaceloma murrayae]